MQKNQEHKVLISKYEEILNNPKPNLPEVFYELIRGELEKEKIALQKLTESEAANARQKLLDETF